ncbi:cysteine--tRNA ligase [Candidatus Peregrinibacteria bacterium]|nr:cysteine--tRNA ligase [Candidatus Peregrinibacteria bacterium]
MSIYNTLNRTKEAFAPIRKKHVGIYLCGPTVYDNAHLGHGRSAVAFDIIRRYFIYKGYKVNFISNYTDIDDKMINHAVEKKIRVSELAELVIPHYVKDYSNLNVLPATKHPRATDYVPQIIELIKQLEDQGATYELEDGIYFNIKTFPDYGKLSNQNIDDLQMGARVDVNKEKKNPQDFALWKKEKPGEPSWDSPWGKGRPGWHIECSAMSMDILGETFDIHAGGADLVFPHHDCEIAQSECATNKPFAHYWMHNGFININKEKMSKSLGNFITLKDLFKEYSGDVIRFLYLQTHYRSPINFSSDLLEQSVNTLQRIHDFVRTLENIQNPGTLHPLVQKEIDTLLATFKERMDDDFDTPEALAALFEFIKAVYVLHKRSPLTTNDAKEILGALRSIDEVFAVIFTKEKETLSDELMHLIGNREKAREEKDWETSDKIRETLKKKGVIVEDTPEGTVWKKTN